MANDEPGDAAATAHLPARIGPFRVDRLLGRGGMGEVYAGWDERLDRPVAIKRIGATQRADREARERFAREARSLAAVRHPGVVTVYEIGETERGELYIAMEFVRGRSLAACLAQPWSTSATVAAGIQIAEALGAAHAGGIIHRDVKPPNVLVEPDGAFKVVDFGLAHRPESVEERLTESGAVVGTPAYMSPEQVQGEAVGPPTDVFAVGVMLYRMVSGVHPFARDSTLATAMAIAIGKHTRLDAMSPHVPAPVVDAIERSLAADPAARYADGRALAAALRIAAEAAALPLERSALVAFARATAPTSAGTPVVTPLAFEATSASPSAPLGVDLASAPTQAAWVARSDSTAGPPGAPDRSASWPDSPTTPSIGPASLAVPPLSAPPMSLPDRPRRRRRIWAPALAAVFAAALAAVLAAAFFWSNGVSESAPVPAAAPASRPPRSLPPRPVVAVLGFAADEPAGRRDAEIIAEALRHWLDDTPDRLVAVQRSALLSMIPPGRGLDASLDPSAFVRPGRALGHVDLAIRGVLAPDAHLRVELVTTDDGAVWSRFDLEARGRRPLELAIGAARAVLERVGAPTDALPDIAPRTDEAWAAYIAAIDARHLSDGAALERNLEWALRIDPGFPPALVEQLQLLRLQRRTTDIATASRALIDSDRRLIARQRALALAWHAFATDDLRSAIRGLHGLLDRWPYDVDAYLLLLAIRFYDPAHRDLHEAELLARKLLAIAPRNPTAASRLVRSLAWCGRADEAAVALAEAGVPDDEPGFIEIRGELALYSGRFDEAIRRFDAARSAEKESLYAEHMGFAARILSGACRDAAVAALGRIDRVETLGREANLDWTYSLTFQAFVCRGHFAEARALLDRWAARSDSGAEQALAFGPNLALVEGKSRAQVADEVHATLEAGVRFPGVVPDLLVVVARVERDLVRLEARAREAERASVDMSRTPAVRGEYAHAQRAIAAQLEFRRDPVGAGRAAIDALVFPASEVRDENDLGARVGAMAIRAEALAELGETDASRAQWLEIAGLGYERLWRTDLWVTARRHLDAP